MLVVKSVSSWHLRMYNEDKSHDRHNSFRYTHNYEIDVRRNHPSNRLPQSGLQATVRSLPFWNAAGNFVVFQDVHV